LNIIQVKKKIENLIEHLDRTEEPKKKRKRNVVLLTNEGDIEV